MILQGATKDFTSGSDTVAAAATEILDQIDLTKTNYAKWFVYIEGTGKSQAFEVLAVERATVTKYSTYALVGDFVSYTIDITSDGSTMDLELTNNEASTLTIKIKRLIT